MDVNRFIVLLCISPGVWYISRTQSNIDKKSEADSCKQKFIIAEFIGGLKSGRSRNLLRGGCCTT